MMLYAAIVALAFLSVESSAEIPAFFAGITKNGDLADGQIIVFDESMVNQGNAYNNNTGIFTAPQDGLYVFQVNLLSGWDEGIFARLFKNDEGVAALYSYNKDKERNYNAVNSAIVSLKTGDTVYVMAYARSSIIANTAMLSSFLGYKIGA